MTDNIKAISDSDLAALDRAFDVGESGGPVTAMTMKRHQYWGLRERLRQREAAINQLINGGEMSRENFRNEIARLSEKLRLAEAVCEAIDKDFNGHNRDCTRGAQCDECDYYEAIEAWRETKGTK